MGFSEFLDIKCFYMQIRTVLASVASVKCHAFNKLVPNLSQQKLPSHVVSTSVTSANRLRLTTHAIQNCKFDKVDSFPAMTVSHYPLEFFFFSFSSKTTEQANGTAIRELLKQEPNSPG